MSGEVTLDGAPLAMGTVVFHHEKGGADAYASTDAGGAYTVRTGTDKGLEPGDYVVTVVAVTGPPPNGKLITPARYGDVQQSGLKVTVVPGDNRFDIPLRWQKGDRQGNQSRSR
jgi:UDP-N-acetylmuramyl tripeptide synthase